MFNRDNYSVIIKELKRIKKDEAKISRQADKERVEWKKGIEERIPDKLYIGLEKAFCKAFILIFQKGSGVIEKMCDQDKAQKSNEIRDYLLKNRGGKKEYRNLRNSARNKNLLNLAVTTVEGVGLGALGIGFPDVVIFVGMLLKGIYESAMHYGFDYKNSAEVYFILKMMEGSMSRTDDWVKLNSEIDTMIKSSNVCEIDESLLNAQIQKTAKAFAVDMLLIKFIQGIPVAGILGGAANPVYYSRVMRFVDLKYRKRFLRAKLMNALEI